jgi:hypothetical protein
MVVEKEDSESPAIEFIQQSLGATSWEWTGEDSAKSDGHISFDSGDEIQIEVSSDVPPGLMRAAAILDRNGSSWPLPKGYGSWRVHVSPCDAFPSFPNEVASLIEDFHANRRMIRDGEVYGVDYRFKGFNIVILQRMADGPDQIVIAASTLDTSKSAFINTSPNALASYAQSHIDEHIRKATEEGKTSKFQKLIDRSEANERKPHYALVVTNPPDVGVRYAMHGIGAHTESEVPDHSLQIPQGLDSFWLIRVDFEWGIEFNAERGWTTYGNKLSWHG